MVSGTSLPGPLNKKRPSFLERQLPPAYTTLLQRANVQKPLQGLWFSFRSALPSLPHIAGATTCSLETTEPGALEIRAPAKRWMCPVVPNLSITRLGSHSPDLVPRSARVPSRLEQGSHTGTDRGRGHTKGLQNRLLHSPQLE